MKKFPKILAFVVFALIAGVCMLINYVNNVNANMSANV
jgi:hypothetical protein